MTLYLIGLGLGSWEYLTQKALTLMRKSDKIYLDSYTSFVDHKLLEELKRLLGPKIVEADRRTLEENASRIVGEAEKMSVCILVPGDPLIATTHLSIVLEAARRRIEVKVVHGVSAYSALISASYLQAYKFGRTVTIPRSGIGVESCYMSIIENMERGLHTLVLLDTTGGGLDIPTAIKLLGKAEEKLSQGLISEKRLIICLARIGFGDEFKWAGSIPDALKIIYPPPPHSIIFPGNLHFSEADALKTMLGADPRIVDAHKPIRFIWTRLSKYISNVEQALTGLEMFESSAEIREIINLVESYLEDSRRFWSEGRSSEALAAISYAEGLLDCLRLLKKVRFSWPR